jgi:hypothetical protein
MSMLKCSKQIYKFCKTEVASIKMPIKLDLKLQQEDGNKKRVTLNQKYRHKKRSTAVLQPFVNLKSNTMKNTMQR